ncbi:unnamed protein product [Rotaria magnacalcarata]
MRGISGIKIYAASCHLCRIISQRFLFISILLTASSASTNLSNMEENMEILENMGFIDRELNHQALTQTGNDIGEAIVFLAESVFFNDDFITPNEQRPTSIFTGSLTADQIQQQQNITLDKTFNNSSNELSMETSNTFTTNAFLNLENRVYRDRWFIPLKRKFNTNKYFYD